MSESHDTPDSAPTPAGDPLESAANAGVVRLLIVGSSRHVLNWRMKELRPLEEHEFRSFCLAHASLRIPTAFPQLPTPSHSGAAPDFREGEHYEMKRFCIGPDNRVTVLPIGEDPAEHSEVFSAIQELLRLSYRWRPSRLAQIWNALPGVEPVRKFPDRCNGVFRIWSWIQNLEETPSGSEGIDHSAKKGAKELAKSAGQRDECPDRNQRTGEPDHMQRFSINHENEIQALHAESALPEGSTEFHSEEELLQVASDWPAARLVEIWNGLTGVTAVRKFKDRTTAAGRIWKQIQSLTPPPRPKPVKHMVTKKGAKKAAADAVAPAGEQADSIAEAATSKKAQVVAMLDTAEGATLAQIMAATGWQKHSVRGFLSGMIGKKMGLKLLSSKDNAGNRTYRIQR